MDKDRKHDQLIKRLQRDVQPREWCWDRINELNESAHDDAYHQWVAAGENETKQEEASQLQQGYFVDLLYEQDDDTIDSIWYWVDRDEEFRDQFSEWYGDVEKALEEYRNN
jgi:hypothetical protein